MMSLFLLTPSKVDGVAPGTRIFSIFVFPCSLTCKSFLPFTPFCNSWNGGWLLHEKLAHLYHLNCLSIFLIPGIFSKALINIVMPVCAVVQTMNRKPGPGLRWCCRGRTYPLPLDAYREGDVQKGRQWCTVKLRPQCDKSENSGCVWFI